MRDSDRATRLEQQLCQRTANDIGVSHDDRMTSLKIAQMIGEQDHTTGRCAGHEAGDAQCEPSCIDGMKAIDVLAGFDSIQDRGTIDMIR